MNPQLKALIEFAESVAHCPHCGHVKKCEPKCTISTDFPEWYKLMVRARKALAAKPIKDNED